MRLIVRNLRRIVLFSSILVGCTTTSSLHQRFPTNAFNDTVIEWHQGGIDQAFKIASEQKRFMLIYWGTRWCPSCAELKATAFQSPEFATAMKDIIAIHLDGDTEYGQAWGEHFQISQYPTLVVLNSERQELYRFSEPLNSQEFLRILQTVQEQNQSFYQLLQTARHQPLNNEQWLLLAHYGWHVQILTPLQTDQQLEQRLRLALDIPATLSAARSLLAARLLESAAFSNDGPIIHRIHGQFGNLINAMMVDQEALYASRAVLLYASEAIIKWAYPQDLKSRDLLWEKWLSAVDKLRADPRLTAYEKMWALYPRILYYRHTEPNSKRIPTALSNEVLLASKLVTALTSSPQEKQAYLPGVAKVLSSALLFNEATSVLDDHLDLVPGPYYFHTKLAEIALLEDDTSLAAKQRMLATNTLGDQATKLQWIVAELAGLRSLATEQSSARTNRLLEMFYDTLFTLKDGFNGRNYRSLRDLENHFKTTKLNASQASLMKSYEIRCHRLTGRYRIRCDAHFKQVLGKSL